MRLDKFLSESALDTRKNVREYIKQGLIKVNGNIETVAYKEIDENNDIITFSDKVIKYSGKVYYMFNKPSGCITARQDERQKTIFDYFENENMNGISHVGRLDKDTEGLLLLTNDGEFNNNLMAPNKHVDKKYFFIALGTLNSDQIKMLEEGICIGNDEPLTKPSKLHIVNQANYLTFKEEFRLHEFYDLSSQNYNPEAIAAYLTISEGRKHQVKRMLKACGCYVIYLKRVSIGEVSLDETLKMGEYRHLTHEEILKLKKN